MRNTINHGVIKRVPYHKSYNIPTILSANVRTIASKVDEIQQIAELNNVNAICITETWLSPNVPDASISIPGSQSISERSDKYNGGKHIHRNLDNPLAKQPNALVLITGDFNPTSTGLKSKDITQANHLKQLVTFKTRDSGILDWFLTNRPKLF